MKPEAFLNVMARIAGFWFTLIGFGFGAWSLYFVLHPDDPRRITPDGSDGLVMNTQVTVIAVLIGAALLSVRTYRPDLGDSAFSRRDGTPRDGRKGRSWWTGEPRP